MAHALTKLLGFALLTAGTLRTGPGETLNVGLEALAHGDLEAATVAFEQVVRDAPDWELGHLQLGVALRLRGNGRLAEARAHLEQAVQLAPSNARAHYELGLACEVLGDAPGAAAAFNRALERRPNLVDARFRLAALVKDQDEARALELYRGVLTTEPAHLGALTALGAIHEAKGQMTEAEMALRTLVRLQPTNAYPLFELARFYERQGEARKAREAYARARAVVPKPARAMRRLR